jgi:hypothetical protein
MWWYVIPVIGAASWYAYKYYKHVLIMYALRLGFRLLGMWLNMKGKMSSPSEQNVRELFYYSSNPSGEQYLHHLEGHANDKTYKINIVSSESSPHPIMSMSEEILDKVVIQRNKLVHCSLMNDAEEMLIDTTEFIRRFAYHFEDDNRSNSAIRHFIQAISKEINVSVNELEQVNLSIYLNDELFTEKLLKVSDIMEKTYAEILG